LTGVKHTANFKLLVAEEFDVGVFLPIHDYGGNWGSMGALRRSTAQFGSPAMSCFRTAPAGCSGASPRFVPELSAEQGATLAAPSIAH